MLRRSAPLKRTGPLKRGSAELKRTPIKSRSAKRGAVMRDERVPTIEALVTAGVGCLIGPFLAEEGIEVRCTGRIDGLHERRKRSAGGSLVNGENLIPACAWCNGWIEDEPEQARQFGTVLVVREGDPEWESLGSRNDR